jgi:hypothetical protein
MADTDSRGAAQDAVSYRAKLLQPSDHDELSTPDQQATAFKLPPAKDAGTPPMTVNTTEAPAGAEDAQPSTAAAAAAAASDKTAQLDIITKGEPRDVVDEVVRSPHGNMWSPTGNTQSPIDGRHRFRKCGSGRMGSAKVDYILPEGFVVVAQPQHVDDYPSDKEEPTAAAKSTTGSAGIAAGDVGLGVSDTEQQAISDPTTDDLVAAATGRPAAAAAVRDEPVEANVSTVEPDETPDVKGIESDIAAVLPGAGSHAGVPIASSATTTTTTTAVAAGAAREPSAAAAQGAPDEDTSAAASGGSRKGGFSAPEPEEDKSTAAAAADIPEPAVGVAKEGDVVSHDLPDVEEDSNKPSGSQNPLAAAAAAVSKPVAAVAKPVAAAVGQLRSAVLGSGGEKSEGVDGDEVEKSEGVRLVEEEAIEIEGGDKVPPFAVL